MWCFITINKISTLEIADHQYYKHLEFHQIGMSLNENNVFHDTQNVRYKVFLAFQNLYQSLRNTMYKKLKAQFELL